MWKSKGKMTKTRTVGTTKNSVIESRSGRWTFAVGESAENLEFRLALQHRVCLGRYE